MSANAINIGAISADLQVDSGHMERGIAKAQGAIQKFQREIETLDALLKNKGIGNAEHQALVQQYKQKIDDLSVGMKTAFSALGPGVDAVALLNTKIKEGTGSTTAFGRAAIQSAWALDDLRYGAQNVVNNLPGLIAAFGGSAGLAGVLAIAGVAASELVKHWDDLLEVFGTGKVKTEAEEMAELEKQTRLTADQAERLARSKAVEGKTGELRDAKTESQKDSEATATKAVTEADIKHVRQGVIATAPEMLDADGDVIAAKKALAEAVKNLADATSEDTAKTTGVSMEALNTPEARLPYEAAITKAKQELEAARRASADKTISADTITKFFPGGPKQLAGLVNKNPAAFGPHANALQAGLEEAQRQADMTPEHRQQKQVGDALKKAFDGIQKGFQKAVEKVADEDAKEAEKALQHRIKAAMPDMKHQADIAADRENRGLQERASSLKELQAALVGAGIPKDKAADAAKKAMAHADEEDPALRAVRLTREARQKAEAAMPDLKDKASHLAMRVDKGEINQADAHKALREQMVKQGMDPDAADRAVGGAMADTDKEDPLHRQRRLRNQDIAKAKEADPELKAQIDAAVANNFAFGRGKQLNDEDLVDKLVKEHGMDSDAAKNGVGGMFKESNERIGNHLQGLQEHAMKQMDNRESSRSEVYSTSDLTNRVQSGISDGQDQEGRKTNEHLEKALEYLQRIANKRDDGWLVTS